MKRYNLNRGASSHIEMIVSFILFAGFVSFLLFYIKPYQQNSLGDSVVEGLHNSFYLYAQVNLSSALISVDAEGNCFSVDLPFVNSEEVFVKHTGGETVEASISGNTLRVHSGSGKYYVLISEEFNVQPLACDPLQSNVSFGNIDSQKVLSSRSLERLKEDYETNYTALKEYLQIPEVANFAIISKEYILQKNIPDSVSVVSKTYSEKVLSSDGKLETKDFVFKVW